MKIHRNKNAGNVEAGVSFFNNAVGLAEEDNRRRYSYAGPVFRFGKYWDDISNDDMLFTEASSKKQAINNLTYKAKQFFGLPANSNLTIYDDYVKADPFTVSQYIKIWRENEARKHFDTCDRCGERLNSQGDCPVCDHGEEGF